MLSQADNARIAAAVAEAEARTSGEILCVLSHKVSDYREVPLAWAAFAALVVPALLAAFGIAPWLGSSDGGDWVASNAVSLNTAIAGYAVLQMAIFALVAIAFAAIEPLKMLVTPSRLKRSRVQRAARQQLAAAHLGGATGVVVLFASEAERIVTVAADEALHLKAGDAAWDAAVAAVLSGIKAGDPTAGFVSAIEVCGGFLADHFPATGEKHNALTDGLIEI